MTTLALSLPEPRPRRLVAALVASAALGLLSAVQPQVAVLLVAASLAPFLVWIRPSSTLLLLAVALGFNVDILKQPVHVSAPQLVALAVVAGVILRPRATPDRQSLGLWGWGGLLFALATIPSMPGAIVPTAALAGLIQMTAAGVILMAATNWLRSEATLSQRLVRCLVIGGAASVLPAVVQVLFQLGPPSYMQDGVMRAYSTYGQPNSYGAYLVGVAPLALALAARKRTYVLPFAVIVLGIVLTGSRGAWVACLASLACLYALRFRWSPRSMAIGLIGVAFVMTAPAWLPDAYLGRLSLVNWSTQQRLLLALMTWQGILRNPLLGYGSGSFPALVPDIALPGYQDDVEHPHNLILHVWLELGLVATLVLVALLAAYFWTTIRAYRRNRNILLAGVIAAAAGMLCAAMFGTLIERGRMEVFMLLVALGGVLARATPPVPLLDVAGGDSRVPESPSGPSRPRSPPRPSGG